MELQTRYVKAIQDIDEHYFVRELSNLSEPLRILRDEASAKDNKRVVELLQNELDALELYTRSFVINPETYERRMPDSIDEYSQEKLEYYSARFAESSNPQLKCQYGDILIDYRGRGRIENKHIIVSNLVPQLIQVAKLSIKDKNEEKFALISALSRAVELCLYYKQEDLLKQSIQEVTNFLSGVGSIYAYRWVIEPTDILLKVMNNSKMKSMIDNVKIQLALRKLNEAREFWLKEKNHQLHRWGCYCLVAWNKKLQQPIFDLNLEIGLSFELEAEHQQGRSEKTEGVKAAFLQMALRHYLKIGATSKVNEMKVKLKKAYLAEQENELKMVMTPMVLPEEFRQYIERILTWYRELENAEKILEALAHDPYLNIDVSNLYLNVEEHFKEFILGALIPTSVIADGRRIAQATEYKEHKELEFRRQYCGRLELQSIFLLMPVLEIMKEKGLSIELLIQRYLDWDFYNPERESLIRTGFERFLAEDYISALHILVPQFEACLRDMFFAIDIPTTVIKEEELQHEQVFGEFINRPEVIEVLGINFHKYIDTVMVAQSGWNIRNNVAHGLAPPVIFTLKYVIIILHLFCVLLNFRITKDEPLKEF